MSREPSDHTFQEPESTTSSARNRLAAEAKAMNSHAPYPRQPKDITSIFALQTSNLQPGQLIKDELFTLFESVGALEIMDPKMDSGFIPEGDSFDADFDVALSLKGEQVLWVMDQLMCLEIEWLEGYPLSQTVFTCLFVSRLLEPGHREASFKESDGVGSRDSLEDILTHKVLRAYCVALIKCLDLSMQVIQGQTYYEEEDFVTHLFGRELLPKTTVEDALSMLEEAKYYMQDEKMLSIRLRSKLEERLVFRENMLDALRGSALAWEQMSADMDEIDASHKAATPTPYAFSSKVQRQLATSTPPRPMLSVNWDQAMVKWRHLIDDTMEAYRLTSLDIISDPQCLQRAVWTFAYRNPQPTTLPRAILQDQLFYEQGPVGAGVGHYELFLADLRNIVLAGDSLVDSASFQVELPSDPRHIRARLLEGFIEKAFDEYLNLYRMVCQNRCRIRRLFTQAVAILDALESEAARVDETISDVPVSGKTKDAYQKELRPLSSWAKFYKLKVMAWTIQMGFETQIYMDDELGSVYWYLSQLTSTQSSLIQHIEGHLKDRMKRKPTAVADCLASQAYLITTRGFADAAKALASALSIFLFHLQALGIITAPKRDFSKQQLFYEARMKPYLNVSNDRIPSASDFEKARKAHIGQSTGEICLEVDEEIKRAKGLLAELKKVSPREGKSIGSEEQFKKEIKGLETTCVALAVNSSQLNRLVEKHGQDTVNGKVECSMERRWHEWWVVPVLREKK